MRDRKTNALHAILLISVIMLIAVVIVLAVSKHTNIFDTSGDYTKDLAKDKSIVAYQQSCEYPGYIDVINNPDNYKDKELKYYGLVKEVKENTFGSLEVTLRITIPDKEVSKIDKSKYNHSQNEKYYYALVKVEIKDSKDNEAYSGENAAVYGVFDKVDEDGVIYLKGKKVVRKETK